MKIDRKKLIDALGELFIATCDSFTSLDVTQVSTDSRSITKKEWFLALKGKNFDGHDYLHTLNSENCAGVIVEKKPENNSLPCIVVKDCLKALQAFSHHHRNSLKECKLIAITGSIGKTTAKEVLKTLLGQDCYASPSSFNNEIGLPKTLLSIEKKHRFGVLEMGARKEFDIKKLVDIASPDICCCLNIGTSHLETFKTQDILTKTKLEIFTQSPHAHWILNADDKKQMNFFESLSHTHPNVTFFGKNKKSDIRLLSSKVQNQSQVLLKIEINKITYEFTFNTPFLEITPNLIAGIAMALTAGASIKDLQKNAKKFTGIHRRFEIKNLSDITIIDDTFNAHPQSMEAGLKRFSSLFKGHKKLAILGDMEELGEHSIQAHKHIGSLITKFDIGFLITVGSKTLETQKKAIESGCEPQNTLHFNSVEDLIKSKINLNQLAQAVYAKASNSVQLNKYLKTLS